MARVLIGNIKGPPGDAFEYEDFTPEQLEELKGKDGTPATHSWNGTVLTVESASGISSADLKGPKGDDGAVDYSRINAALNRTTNVNAADTNYTTLMARGMSLNSSDTNPAVNGAIAWTYK